MVEIVDELLPERSYRSHPRVVKKRASKFPSKKPFHRGTGSQAKALTFQILNTT